MITQKRLKELFDYHPSGTFIEKTNRTRWRKPGDLLLNKRADCKKHILVCVDMKKVALHRLIFLWHYGSLPETIDHKDRKYQNNKIENLRPATRSQQMQNRTKQEGKRYKGVYLCAKTKKSFYCSVAGNVRGPFKSEILAATVYDKMAKELYGEYACTNF